MVARSRALTAATLACAALSACSGVVPVKNVETDKLGYLAKTFSLPTVPSGSRPSFGRRTRVPCRFSA